MESTIQNLDIACLSNIFEKLNCLLDLLTVSQVCKSWNQLLADDQLWHQVYIANFGPPDSSEFVGSFKSQFRRACMLSSETGVSLVGQCPQALGVTYDSTTQLVLLALVSPQPQEHQHLDKTVRIVLVPERLLSSLFDLAPKEAGQAVYPSVSQIDQWWSDLEVLTCVEIPAKSTLPMAASAGRLLFPSGPQLDMIQVFDLASKQHVASFMGHTCKVKQIVADGCVAASLTAEDIRLWDLNSLTCMATIVIPPFLHKPDDPVSRIAISARHGLLATLNVFCSPTGLHVFSFQPPHSNPRTGASTSSTHPQSLTQAAHRPSTGSQPPLSPVMIMPLPPQETAPASLFRLNSSATGDVGEVSLVQRLPVNSGAEVVFHRDSIVVLARFLSALPTGQPQSLSQADAASTFVASVWKLPNWEKNCFVSPRLLCEGTHVSRSHWMPRMAVSEGTVIFDVCTQVDGGSLLAFPGICTNTSKGLAPAVPSSALVVSDSEREACITLQEGVEPKVEVLALSPHFMYVLGERHNLQIFKIHC